MTTERVDYTQVPTNFVDKRVGNLGHDAYIFDRTCPTCRGIYHSLSTPACPKCGGQLTYLTTRDGKPMAITECSFYPIFGKKTIEHWTADTEKRKGGLGVIWRFVIINYADKNGVLAEHPISMMLKRCATIELRIYNHPPFFKLVDSKKNPGKQMVEVKYMIFPNYGDVIKVLKQPNTLVTKTAVHPTAGAVPPTGSVSPELIAAITAQVVATLAGKGAVTTPPPVVKPATVPAAAVAATAEEDIDNQVLNSLYGDMDTEMMEDFPEQAATLANVNPWN